MASLQILKCNLSPLPVPNSRRKSFYRKVTNFQNRRSSEIFSYRSLRVACKVQEDDNQRKGEEPPESLFMKELKRRGMTPTSLLEESNRSMFGDEEMKFKEEEGGYSKRKAVTTDYDKSLYNQRERSIALNSEGLEGLIPRAKLLLSLGGTFFLAFWHLILITVASFSAVYLYFGSAFVHDGNAATLPQHIDPYALLEDERISQTAPQVN